jgi:hypothetical protein
MAISKKLHRRKLLTICLMSDSRVFLLICEYKYYIFVYFMIYASDGSLVFSKISFA